VAIASTERVLRERESQASQHGSLPDRGAFTRLGQFSQRAMQYRNREKTGCRIPVLDEIVAPCRQQKGRPKAPF
jgi:hypothetical protein